MELGEHLLGRTRLVGVTGVRTAHLHEAFLAITAIRHNVVWLIAVSVSNNKAVGNHGSKAVDSISHKDPSTHA
jgi:hypothetical protein